MVAITNFIEFTQTSLGQFSIIALSVLFIVAVTFAILNKTANPHKSKVFVQISLLFGFFLLLFSLLPFFQTAS